MSAESTSMLTFADLIRVMRSIPEVPWAKWRRRVQLRPSDFATEGSVYLVQFPDEFRDLLDIGRETRITHVIVAHPDTLCSVRRMCGVPFVTDDELAAMLAYEVDQRDIGRPDIMTIPNDPIQPLRCPEPGCDRLAGHWEYPHRFREDDPVPAVSPEDQRAAETERKFPVQGGPSIPWRVIEPFDYWCRKNHGGQTLEGIAGRGGLSVRETIAVLTAREFYELWQPNTWPANAAADILHLQRLVRERCAGMECSECPTCAASKTRVEQAEASIAALREQMKRVVDDLHEKATEECTERGPGWVGADSAYRVAADEIEAALTSSPPIATPEPKTR